MADDDLDYEQAIERAYLSLMQSETEAALDLCQDAARIKPLGLGHLYLLGLVSLAMRDLGRGIKFLEEGHRRAPNNKEFADALAALTARVGNMSDSMYYAKLALVTDSDPGLAKFAPKEFEELDRNIEHAGVATYFVDAVIAFHERNYLGAVDLCGKELAVHPYNAECHQLLGRAWTEIHEYDEAIASMGRAIELEPGNADNYIYLGDAQMAAGRRADAEATYRDGIERFPDQIDLHNRLIEAAAFGTDHAPDSALGEVVSVSDLLAGRVGDLPVRPLGPSNPEKRLIIGFLINESVLTDSVRFVESLFRVYDRSRTKFVVYQQYSQPFPGTTMLRQAVDDWRATYDIDDATFDLIIRNDRIGVLVDLCGLRPGHRQSVLSGRPAPVIVNWLGFPYAPVHATTDAIIVDDAIRDTVPTAGTGVDVVSLGGGVVAYGGGSVELETGADPTPPAGSNGFVTFGAYLDQIRLVESAALWASVLEAAPGTVLLLGANGDVRDGTVRFVRQLFGDLGVADRIVLPEAGSPATARAGFLAAVDVVLESRHVCNPSLMCDALWMGVPVIAIDGDRPGARLARSVLTAGGQGDWVAADEVAFVATAADLAGDVGRLAALRGTLRETLKASRLCDEKAFVTRFVETLENLADQAA